MTKADPHSIEISAHLTAIIDSSDDAIIGKKLDGTITSWNPAAERIFGYSAAEALGRHISLIIPKEREDEEAIIIGKVKAGERLDHFETQRRTKSGELIELSITVSPIKNADGVIVGASKIARDIRDAKNAHRTSAYLAAIVESSDDGIISKNLNGVITSWNAAAHRIFGYSAAEAIGNHIGMLIPENMFDEEHHILSKIKQGQRIDHFETVRKTKDGRLLNISLTISPIRDSDNNVIGASKIVRDISEKKLIEQELKQITNVIPQQVWTARPSGEIDYVNDHTIEYAGNIPVENGVVQWTGIVHPDDLPNSLKVWMHSVTTGEPYEVQQRLLQKDNTYRWHLSRALPLKNEKGEITKWFGTNTDIQEYKQTLHDLTQARIAADTANLAKTEFLTNMSHEIRTPMNAIIGLSSILVRSQPLTAKQTEYVKTLQMSADSLLALINDLLDISKIEARNIELEEIPFSVIQLIEDVSGIMASQAKVKGLDFSFVSKCDCIHRRTFLGDPARLRQILLNLCSNALKFTEKGAVRIDIFCQHGDRPGYEDVKLEIHDTGIGIAPEHLENIFQKFVQADRSINRKYGGTGLGLAITKTLAEIMGGSVSVKSQKGKGSTFTLDIPLKTAHTEELRNLPASPAESDDTAREKNKHVILLVEDYAPNILVAAAFLEQFGYSCDIAENGIEAVEKVKKQHYDVVLMDVQMHGMNGLEATAAIRDYCASHGRPHIPIIGMTAHALSGDREKCLAAGMDDYISKPFSSSELKERLETAVKESSERISRNASRS